MLVSIAGWICQSTHGGQSFHDAKLETASLLVMRALSVV